MTVADQFQAALLRARDRPELAGPGGEGARVAWAAAEVLQADGAGVGLSVDQMLRLPWGASDEVAAVAEQLQFTAGQGPCLDAFAGGEAVMASRLIISRFWPGFAEPFLLRTPFRSVFAIPIDGIGVLDVYFCQEQGCLAVDVGAATEVASQVAYAVTESDALMVIDPSTGTPAAVGGRRAKVPVAVGILVAALHVTAPDALAILRGHAFAGDRSVDDVAADIVDGTLGPHLWE